nr:uncharacterized protein LOC126055247 [Helicoverpa armigera]XP_049699596.1 uncharacterized protein LOC126055247 [Helicoverpa armigera]XP_049699597.1 uncharacterized protein LOC126055247 [Helicoverpa armigera]
MSVRRRVTGALRRWRALLAGGALLAALCVRVPARLHAELHFPAHAPADIAHHLADFSNQPGITSWRVTEDRSNYTTWQYAVQFTCGARCGGTAWVVAHDEPAPGGPRHGRAARRHRVALRARVCSAPPLLPWPRLCEELEVEGSVWADAAAGARLRLQWLRRCGALGWLRGACGRELRADRDARRAALSAAPHAVRL